MVGGSIWNEDVPWGHRAHPPKIGSCNDRPVGRSGRGGEQKNFIEKSLTCIRGDFKHTAESSGVGSRGARHARSLWRGSGTRNKTKVQFSELLT